MFGDRRVIDEGAIERARQAVSARNTNAYQNYKKALEDSWNSQDFLTKVATGVSGGGWGKGGFLKNYGIDNSMDAAGNAGQIGTTDLNSLIDYGRAYGQERTKQLDQGRDLFGGIPIIGGIISPFAQVVSAGKDLAESGTENWKNGKRSLVSDLGAGIEAGLTVAGAASALKGLSAAGKAKALANAPKTALQAIGRGAGTGALYGGVGSLGSYLNRTGDESTVGEALLNTGIGAGIGGLMGGAISGGSYGLGKLRANALASSPEAQQASQALSDAQNKVSTYQDALKTATSAGLDTSSPEALQQSYRNWAIQNHPDKVGNVVALLPSSTANNPVMSAQDIASATAAAREAATAAATAANAPVNSAYNTLSTTAGGLEALKGDVKAYQKALNTILNKEVRGRVASTKLGKLMNTKLGKAAAVGGGAYTLSKLLSSSKGEE